jgi:molybdopterin-guanine dinucleotide biosynthesis protein A
LVDRYCDELRPLFADAFLVGSDAASYGHLPLRRVPDRLQDRGPPGGVHAALVAATTPWVFAIACDMPFVTSRVVARILMARSEACDAAMFEIDGRLEPLLAAYHARLADEWAKLLQQSRSFADLLVGRRVIRLGEEALREVDPSLLAVRSVNTPQDLEQLGLNLRGDESG